MKTKYKMPEFEVEFNGRAKTWMEAVEPDFPLLKTIVQVSEDAKSTSFRKLEKMIESGDGKGIIALAAMYCETIYKPSASTVARMKQRESADGKPYVKRPYKRKSKKIG